MNRYGKYCRYVWKVVVSFMVVGLCLESQARAGNSWYNSSWCCRKVITINNTNNANNLTNYQTPVSVAYDSDMQNDFDDIRFTDSDGVTLLDYWRETFTASTSATFWVKVPSIPASSKRAVYMYYGNAETTSASNGLETFESSGFDDFESYDTGPLKGQAASAANAWSKYANNPVLQTTNTDGFSSVFKDGDTYHMYYSWGRINHATSSDGLTWTVDTENNPVLSPSEPWEGSNVGVPMVWKEGPTWYMLYRGGRPMKIGLATSADGINWKKENNNPVLKGTPGKWDDGMMDPWGVMKVGSTYYLWYNRVETGPNRATGLATSTDLINWTKDSNNPIFTGGRFCGFPFKYGNYYYFLIPHYTSGGDYSQLELYRDTKPTFYSTSRELVRIAINYGASEEWDDRDLDTACILTDDIYRNSFNLTNNQLWAYYAGSPDGSAIWYTGLTIETNIAAALEPEKANKLPSWKGGAVVDTPTRQGSRAIRQSDTFPSNNTQIDTSFNPKTTGAIGAWMRKNNIKTSYHMYVYSGATLAICTGFNPNRFGGTTVAYSPDTWYLVILEFNTDTDKYNFVVHDTNLNEIAREDNRSFLKASGAINRIMFYTSNADVVDGYIDDFRLRKHSSPEPSVSLLNKEVIPKSIKRTKRIK